MSWFNSKNDLIADIVANVPHAEELAGHVLYDDLTFTGGDHSIHVYGAVIVENNEDETQARKRTIDYIVIDEGDAGEKAQYKENGKRETFPVNVAAKQALVNYVETMTGYRGHEIIDINVDNSFKFAKIKLYQFVTDHVEEKMYVIYKDGGAPITEVEMTVFI